MMINQSIMCGTPVVAFEMGAALDFVGNGKTGFRATLGDCNELAAGLKEIILMDTKAKERMDLNCTEMSLNLLQTHQIAAQFKMIISENIKSN
jgi:glycosyltransferase involved in cell wall biosynthesis